MSGTRAPAGRNGLEIAVVGMAARLPGAADPEQLWRNLCGGVGSISFFSDAELAAAGVAPELLANPGYVRAQGVLADVESFDAAFFGYSPREAEILDPQHRFFLESAWTALEHAGYHPAGFRGAIGVYGGVGMSQYFLNHLHGNPDLVHALGDFHAGIGNDKDFLSTRVSYKLNLGGPSLTVQTACSTSLVAVHLACQALLSGECDMALAGGVSIALPQRVGYLHTAGGILSPDGFCRAFDAAAQGCVGGSGVGVVVLRRLDDALADGDTLHAVIKGSAINNDGAAKLGFTAPGLAGQVKVIRRALRMAEVEPDSIGYVEAHGTATALGDPIEIAALSRVFRERTQRQGFCAVGSVKTNVGHLDAAAGVAGLLKTVLSLEHGKLPPSLHFERPNPRIDFANSPFYVNATLADWPAGPGPRRAGVSAFGIGGTNAHVVLEEAPAVRPEPSTRPWHLFVLSARSPAALATAADNLASYLRRRPEVDAADLAFTLGVGRKVHACRRAMVAAGAGDLAGLLAATAAGRVFTSAGEAAPPPVAFLLPGQGAQHPAMGAELYRHLPAFRRDIDRCAELLVPHLGHDLRRVLFPVAGAAAEEAARELAQTRCAQPAIFTVEYALAGLWMDWGIAPQSMLGHSIGEYVAACLAGVFTLADALALVAARGRLMQELPAGAMLVVPLGEPELLPLLGGELSLAAVNGPGVCVVAGPEPALAAWGEGLRAHGVECRRLHTSHAFHSASMDPVLAPFRREVEKVALGAPRIPYLSNLTGTWISAAEATDPDYWVRHLRGTVRFADGLEKLLSDPATVLLEVGPGRGLGTLVRRHPGAGAERLVLASLPHPRDREPELASLLAAAGRLWLAGAPIDWPRLYAGEKRRRIPLPTYPFERRRYWVEAGTARNPSAAAPAAVAGPPRKRPDVADWFYVPLWRQDPQLPPVSSTAGSPTVGSGSAGAAGSAEDGAGDWLVLADERLAGRLAGRLPARGGAVVTVEAGEGFRRLAADRFSIDPRRREDYLRLLGELAAAGRRIVRVVHLWTVSPSATGQRGLDLGFWSLLHLAQAIGEESLARGAGGTLRLDVVTSGVQRVSGEETVSPERAAVLGPCRVIPREYPGVACRSVDVVLPALPENDAGWQLLVDQLLGELAADETEPIVAYRGWHRWLQTFASCRLAADRSPSRLRDEGVYMITGGLGGIGLALAEHLAGAVRARLVLVGRSAFPGRGGWPAWLAAHGEGDEVSARIRRLQALEALGAEILVCSADVADREAMQRALGAARARFGALHGVIHAAGVPPCGMIQLKTRQEAAAVLAPKVAGTRVIAELLTGSELDFMVLCSSLSSVLGEPGRADYAAANGFLDAFALAAQAPGGPVTVAIGWDGWSAVGMSARRQPESDADRAALAEAMTAAEGVEAFRRALASGLPQVLVSTRDFAARLAASRAATADSSLAALTAAHGARSSYPRPQLAVAYAAPESEAERALAEIWRDLLGVDPIGADDNFFQLGGDSLIGLQMVSRASRAGLPFAAGELFEHPTVRELAGVAGRARPPAAAQAQGPVAGPVPLTPAQAWFFDRDLPDRRHWNQAQLLEVRQALAPALLAASVGDLVRRHDALRLRFTPAGTGWRQVAGAPGGPAPFTQIDLSALAAARRGGALADAAGQLQVSLDLARGPVLRVALFALGPARSSRLLLVAHHLVVDVPSWQILVEDLLAAYLQRSRGEIPRLPAATTAFTRWAERLAEHARSGALDAEAGYWLAAPRTRSTPPLPVDLPGGANTAGSARTLSVSLDAAATRQLLREVPARQAGQPSELLLTALARAFHRWTGHPVLRVELEGHGREALFGGVDLSRTVGWFTSLYPVLLDLAAADGPATALARVRGELRAVPSRGMSFGLLRHLGGDPVLAARLRALPPAEVSFAYLGEVDQPVGEHAPWRLADEPAGPTASPSGARGHLLEINALVLGGELIQNWTYSGARHREATLRAVAETAVAELRTLIARCLGTDESGPAVADFADAKLSQDELNEILARYAEPAAVEGTR